MPRPPTIKLPYIRVPCPSCGAAIGEPCQPLKRTTQREKKQNYAAFHLERKFAWAKTLPTDTE